MESNSHELQNQFSLEIHTESENKKNFNNHKFIKNSASSKNPNSFGRRNNIDYDSQRKFESLNESNVVESHRLLQNIDQLNQLNLNNNQSRINYVKSEKNNYNYKKGTFNQRRNDFYQMPNFNPQNKQFASKRGNTFKNNNKRNVDNLTNQTEFYNKSLSNKGYNNQRNQSFERFPSNQRNIVDNYHNYNKLEKFKQITKIQQKYPHEKLNQIENKDFTDINRSNNRNNGTCFFRQNFNEACKERNNCELRNYNNGYKNKGVLFKNEVNKSNNKKIDVSKLDQREYLIHELNLNHYECMICMDIIQKNNAIWNCDNCYHIFHLNCISKWTESIDKNGTEEESLYWRCPACQSNNIRSEKLLYTCFCKKEISPAFKFGTIAHSCGDVCGKNNETNKKCPHMCTLQCHPGPCPPCEASVTRQCHCGYTRMTTKCTADETQFQCQSLCGKKLQCGLHICEELCHVEDGHICNTIITRKCWCDSSSKDILCGSHESISLRFNCEKICGRKKMCGNHYCESLCHEGDCEECEHLPNKIKTCFCGKETLSALFFERLECLDPIPSCGNICEKYFRRCDHKCGKICHKGSCQPCPGTMLSKCYCQNSLLTVECASSETPQCNKKCNSKLLCGRHRCDKQCCDKEVHICTLKCDRMLSCKIHRCERECGHLGQCPSCPNVSFDELFCECRGTFTLPPIACNQEPPQCHLQCSRQHLCDHQVRHNCHSDYICPPCTELVSKMCPGGHREYKNVPCFRPLATCGLICCKPLQNCNHKCIKLCHAGECIEDGEVCKQSCDILRNDCNHPCAAVCHDEDCDKVIAKCCKELVLACECTLRSSLIVCHKLKYIKCLLKSDNANMSADLVISSKDDNVYLTCDSDCKRAARNTKLAEVFNIEMPLSVLYTYYPESVKDFGLKNKNYAVRIQNILVNIQNSFNNNTNVSISETICPVTIEERHFIQKYTSCFKMLSVYGTDKKNRQFVTVEARRGISQVPKPLLTEVLKKNYPNLFPEKVLEKVELLTTAPGASLSFADRLKLNK